MSLAREESYNLLKSKTIYAILDGDISLGDCKLKDGNVFPVSMPKLTGSSICNISTKFGLYQQYKGDSRWWYFENLLGFCIENKKCSKLLAYLFRKEHFSQILAGHSVSDIDFAYNCIVQKAIDKINEQLCFSDHELRKVGQQYIIKRIDEKFELQVPNIKTIDQEYIKSLYLRAIEDVRTGNFDSAITKSRTLLEEVFCHVIEEKHEKIERNGDIGKLYNHVKTLYSMHRDKKTGNRINELLCGLEKIVTSISDMRNNNSDAHGVGSARINIYNYHARLFVNAAITMADFILSVADKANN